MKVTTSRTAKRILASCATLLYVAITTFGSLVMHTVPVFALPCGPLASYGPQYASYATYSYLPSNFSYYSYLAKVGGVSLDQAATFLANMSDVTGAYFDQATNRIVFMGPHNTSTPIFDKDDLAVAIRSVVFNNTIPAVNIGNLSNPSQNPMPVTYFGGIENTHFGSVLEDADFNLKTLMMGRNSSGQLVGTSATGYASFPDRFLAQTPSLSDSANSGGRLWINPQFVNIKKDDANNSFVFDQVKMQVSYQALGTNSAKFDNAFTGLAQELTNNYDTHANEIGSWKQTKELAKIVSVVKWLKDNNVATDYTWAQNYTPTPVTTPTAVNMWSYNQQQNNLLWSFTGGVYYDTANNYAADNGTSAALKTSSQTVAPSPEANHWSFTQGGQNYDSVAVSADAFRSVGTYSTRTSDLAVKTTAGNSLDFTRTYSSFDSRSKTAVGNGWSWVPASLTAPQPWYAVNDAPTNGFSGSYPVRLIYQDSTGDYDTYTYNTGTHTYQPDQADYYTQLIRNADGSYSAVNKNQSYYKFGSGLALLMFRDKNSNGIYYQYDGTTHITRIQDDAGHTITLNYDSSGMLTSVVDWTGRTLTYGYDANGNLVSVTDPRGNVIHYTYDASNRLSTTTDRSARQILSNTYNDKNKVVTQTNASGLTVNFSYDEVNRVASGTDVNGNTTKTYYDSRGRMTQQTDPNNNATIYTYGTQALPLTVKDKRGNVTTYTYDGSGNTTTMAYPNGSQIAYQYNAKNLVTQITDTRYSPSKVSTFAYDGSGNLLTKTEAGLSTTYSYDTAGQSLSNTDPLDHTTKLTRGAFGTVATETAATGGTKSSTYDALGRLSQQSDASGKTSAFTYDANNNVLTVTTGSGTVTNSYSPDNTLLQTTDQDNKITNYAYAASGAQTSTTDALTSLTTYGYDQYTNLTSKQDALNHTSQYAYDKVGNKTQSTTPLGKIAKWTYDQNGNITKRTDESNRDTTYTYDNMNRLSQIKYPDLTTATYTYDSRGNVLSITGPNGTTSNTYDIFNRVTTTTDPHNVTTSYTYDNADNLISITYPGSKAVSYKYDAANRLKSVSDWNSAKTYMNYNQNNTLQSKILPNNIYANYSYDSANRLASLQYSQNQSLITKFAYARDGRGNITSETENKSAAPATFTIFDEALPTGWSTSWSWNSAINTADTSNPYQGTKDISWQVTSPWGGLHMRSTTGTVSTAPYTALTIAMKSTQAGQGVGIGLKNSTDGFTGPRVDISRYGYPVSSGYTVYVIPLAAFNALNTQISGLEIDDFTGAAQPKMYIDAIYLTTTTPTPISMYKDGLNPIFNRWSWNDTVNEADTTQPFQGTQDLSMTGTSGWSGVQFNVSSGVPTNGYDNLQFALKGSQTNQDFTVQMTNASGTALAPELDISRYAGRADSSDYTVYSIPLADVNAANTVTNGFILQSQNSTAQPTILLDDVKLVALPTGPTTSQQATFTYDSLSRLLTASYPFGNYSYTYDKVGNRLTSNEAGVASAYTTNNDNQLTAKGTRTFTYDNLGNRITDAGKTLSFDFNSLLKSYAVPGSTTVSYVYDAAGNRIEKNVSGGSNYQYVNDTSRRLARTLVTKNVTSSTSNYYVYAGSLLSQGDTAAANRQYYLDDGMGNVRYTTSSTGATLQTFTYDAYGNTVLGTGSDMGYREQAKDQEDGLIYLRARYYDATTGTFTSHDPISGTLTNAQTQNGYNYANDNPINMFDPSGQNAVSNFFSGIGKSISNFFSTSSKSTCTSYVTAPGLGSIKAGSSSADAQAVLEAMGYSIPDNYIAVPATNGKGWVFRSPTNNTANTFRVMEPTQQNPTGYLRITDGSGSYVDINGTPMPKFSPETHIPLPSGNGLEGIPLEEYPFLLNLFY